MEEDNGHQEKRRRLAKEEKQPIVRETIYQMEDARQMRVTLVEKILELLVHASKCRFPKCTYSNCRKVKGLFRHGMQCHLRAVGGCDLCKKMWNILILHARICKETDCTVPRCKDLKEHLRRLQQQSD